MAVTEPDPAWARHCERAGAQLRQHGHLRRAGAPTRKWADQQIRALRAGTMPAELERQLDEIGLTGDSLTTTEATLLAELDWWIAKHGDADVPQMAHSRKVAGAPYWLGKRISEARIAHGRGALAPALARLLEERAGWSWRVREDRWDRMWEEKLTALAAHVITHGSIDGLDRLDRPTYQWLMRQRAGFSELPADRRRRLEDIPGALLSRDTRVRDFVTAAQTWLAQGPSTGRHRRTMADLRYADSISVGDVRVPLGKRVTYYRRRFAGLEGTHPLTSTEVAQIEALPGWSWRLQERGRRSAAPASPDGPPAGTDPDRD